ncbi:MAG: hypothetical protein GVY29_10830 [Spirochaetes bacterium]|jgi:hypothetical protein|nr:hypothetical protein [Spirochaetota bacterium]
MRWKAGKTDEIAKRREITRRAVNKNHAAHHLGDYVQAVRMAAAELDAGLGIGHGDPT